MNEEGTSVPEVKDKAKKLSVQARQRAVGLADERRGEVSSRLTSLADVVAELGGSLEQRGIPARGVLNNASEWLRRLSSDIENQSAEELMKRAETRFRERPGAFIAGIFALGFIGGRLLRR